MAAVLKIGGEGKPICDGLPHSEYPLIIETRKAQPDATAGGLKHLTPA